MDKNSFIFTTKGILETIERDFATEYKPFAKYQSEKLPLYILCIEAINNHDFMNKAIFANDYLEVPPVKSFAAYNKEDTAFKSLSDYDKKYLGAFWGFVFRSLGYEDSRKVSLGGNFSLKTGSFFKNNSDKIVVAENDETKAEKVIKTSAVKPTEDIVKTDKIDKEK